MLRHLSGLGEVGIEAYEAGVRAVSDLQRLVASAIDLEPARSIAGMCADMTRDLGATVAASARWILER